MVNVIRLLLDADVLPHKFLLRRHNSDCFGVCVREVVLKLLEFVFVVFVELFELLRRHLHEVIILILQVAFLRRRDLLPQLLDGLLGLAELVDAEVVYLEILCRVDRPDLHAILPRRPSVQLVSPAVNIS
jgi:hypothetical protein